MRFGVGSVTCSRELEQSFGKARRQVQKGNILNLLAGMTQSRTEDLDEFESYIRIVLKKRNKIPAFYHDELAIRHRRGIRCTRATIEQSNLAEQIALAENIQNYILTVDRRDTDLDRARQDPNEASARIPFHEDRGTARHSAGFHV